MYAKTKMERSDNEDAKAVRDFWYSDEARKKWYSKDDAFDQEIRDKFMDLYTKAKDGKLQHWESDPLSVVSLVVLLDQFPRNMFRNKPESFATDAQALASAKAVISKGFDMQVSTMMQQNLYLPFLHSENLEDQNLGIEYYQERRPGENGEKNKAVFPRKHQVIIAQFGRFPHRNHILGRENTPEETAYLKEHSGF